MALRFNPLTGQFNVVIVPPSNVTSSTVISQLVTGPWTAVNAYNGTTIVGQKAGDYYDDGATRYNFLTATSVRRIPYSNL